MRFDLTARGLYSARNFAEARRKNCHEQIHRAASRGPVSRAGPSSSASAAAGTRN